MTKRYIINKSKNVGNVIFILEGSVTEFDLLKKVFVDILGYQFEELRRTNTSGFLLHGHNPHSRIVGINFKGNRLFDIIEEEKNELFFRISDELGIKPENAAIYYIYDRDVKSYGIDEVRTYVEKYQDPYGTDIGDQGQLILSYPALESYTVSCFRDKTYETSYELGRELKQYAAQNSYTIQMLRNETHIIHATSEMDCALSSYGIDEYDLDNLGQTLLDLYDCEQQAYLDTRKFSLVSALSFVLLELGVIEESENNDALKPQS